MNYISTRGGIAPVDFRGAVMMGLARDGGLLLPERIPDVRERLPAWRALAYPELAGAILAEYADVPAADLARLVRASYATFRHPEVTPVVRAGPVHILELFHGPTLAFKDVALQLLGRLFEYYLGPSGATLNIVGATSGDTGSAAIHGVRGRSGIRIFILYPEGRTSLVQERQMTSVLDDNVRCLAIRGTFDDCQAIVKSLFNDLALKDRLRLGAINSINWARVLAQVVYYFYGVFRVQAATGAPAVSVTVPTGNFGDIFAGYLAARMGLPIRRLVLATNENDILARFFASGEYRLGGVRPTLSPSMDIQVASNFERYLYYRVGADPSAVRALMAAFAREGALRAPPAGDDRDLWAAGRADESDCLATIRRYATTHGQVLDPHTAVGVTVAERQLEAGTPMLCLATAHPAKFPEAIVRACGQPLGGHPAVEALMDLPTRKTTLPADEAAVRAVIEQVCDAGA